VKKRIKQPAILIITLFALTLTACNRPAPTATPTPLPTPTLTQASPTPAPNEVEEEPPLYLNIIWHQHQPIYFKDDATNVYEKPWVRLHAAKDYVDMAAILDDYPDIQATYNLTPSLLRQIIDLQNGATDRYALHTELPAVDLSDEQADFIASRFFDINPKIIARFPRYQQIADQRDQRDEWDEQTWLDLQVLFNLGWTDPDYLAQEPLASLVAQGRDFSEADKVIVLAEHQRLIAEVIPLHKRLQDEGRIEITTTPFFHPILPLLLDSNLASQAVPDIDLPVRYTYGLDAIKQIEMGVDFYTETFGQVPRGMWPAEGAVAQEIVTMISKADIRWIASDEEVLARSLGRKGFTRNSSETVQEAADLYQPYLASGSNDNSVHIVFRDKAISDKVGFTYSGQAGSAAARDLIERLINIRQQLRETSSPTQPHLVSIILDGENAWEHYPNDGKEFLHNFYQNLEAEQEKGTIRTITPSAYLDLIDEQTPELDDLWAGSWVSPDYLTWIGEEEENRAWEYLQKVRRFVQLQQNKLDEETLTQVMDAIYTAEGSDWFWWYGSDQNSGDDGSFDEQFRRTLQRVYTLMDRPIPTFLRVPVIPATTQTPSTGVTDLIAPTIDGKVDPNEWAAAGQYVESGGVQATAEQIIDTIYYGFDAENLYLRIDARRPWADIGEETRVGVYLTQAGAIHEQPFTRVSQRTATETLLGFSANMLFETVVKDGSAAPFLLPVNADSEYEYQEAFLSAATQGSVLEVALPYEYYSKPAAGDAIKLRVVVSEGERRDVQLAPGSGPAQLIVPDFGLTTTLLEIVDPTGDDHGPGTYTYPTDAIFSPGTYDLTTFSFSEDEANYIFGFTFAGKLNNEWGAPNGMGIHTLDLYIDAIDGGNRKLLPGRNASLPEENGWDLALWAEGWTPELIGFEGDALAEGNSDRVPQTLGGSESFDVVSDAGNGKITLRIAKSTVADALDQSMDQLDPSAWNLLAIVAAQEGFPSSGVWRIRDVETSAQQWRFGGAPGGDQRDTNHTRIIDVAYSAESGISQEELLSDYPSSQTRDIDTLGADEFAVLEMTR